MMAKALRSRTKKGRKTGYCKGGSTRTSKRCTYANVIAGLEFKLEGKKVTDNLSEFIERQDKLANMKLNELEALHKKIIHKQELKISDNYFSDETTVSIIDNPESFGVDIKKKKVMMTPDEFLELAKYTSDKKEMRDSSTDTYQRINVHEPHTAEVKAWLNKGNKFTMPFIELNNGIPSEHEGRHRAVVMKQMGIKKMPVMVYEEFGSGYHSRKHKSESLKYRGFNDAEKKRVKKRIKEIMKD